MIAGPVVLPMHGVGGARDLPIPASLAISAAVAALVVSFTVLIVAWRSPRYDARTQGRPVPAWAARLVESSGLRWTLRVLGLLAAGYVGWPTLAGPDVVTNPVFGSFYVLVWVGIVPFSLLLGPAFKLVSPMRTINLLLAKATRGDPARGVFRYPVRLGYWPASVGLFGYVWQELVNPQSTLLGSVRLWLAVYVAAMLVGSALFRRHLVRAGGPLRGLLQPGRPARPGRTSWRRTAGLPQPAERPGRRPGRSGAGGGAERAVRQHRLRQLQGQAQLAGLRGPSADPAGAHRHPGSADVLPGGGGDVLPGRDGHSRSSRRSTDLPRSALPGRLVHSVVPIVVGYMTAHYLSYFVEQGQTTLIQLSDPMVRGDNYLGTANWTVDYWLSGHPSFLATTKVLAVVAGHITGAVAAHDRALKLLPRRHQVTGQLGMLLIMVAYTGTGLYLLFGS
ncbi:MAG: hypothetical protein ACR2FG_07295 [Marmoricola sp.]